MENITSNRMRARMTTFYPTSDESTTLSCIVSISKREIIIEYDDEDGTTQYKGINNDDGNFENGHFHLHAPNVNGKATLHRFPPDSKILEGFWVEGNPASDGMWRIILE